jgi:cyanophycinase
MRSGLLFWSFLLAISSSSPVFLSTAWSEELTALEDFDGTGGTIVAIGGGTPPVEVADQLREHLQDDGEVLILPDAAQDPLLASEEATNWLRSQNITRVLPRTEPLDEAGRARVLAAVRTASAVYLCGDSGSRLIEAWSGTPMEQELQQLLQRGGMLIGTSAGAAVLSRNMIASGTTEPVLEQGWGLLPDTIVEDDFSEPSRLERSRAAVSRYPGTLGLGLNKNTAIILRGRQFQVVGTGRATAILGACRYRAEEIIPIESGERADLTQLRRAARQRMSETDPGITQAAAVQVPSGALIIVGGGIMPRDVAERFVELAGGSQARIVVLPTATPRDQTDLRVPGFLQNAKVQRVTVLNQRGKSEVQSPEFLEALEDATGIWFGGGRQWNFVDAYENTPAIAAFQQVLSRGGVIAGSSAGATIQGEFLVRGHPLGNTVMMAEGYERGFAFLPGSAIDQHFAQRQREPDLLAVIHRHPGLLGIGLDEGTAIVVRQGRADVIGLHSAHFLAGQRLAGIPAESLPVTAAEAKALYVTVPTGGSINLQTLTPDSP